MKKIAVLLLFSCALTACKKENIEPVKWYQLEASIKFTAPYIGEFYMDSVQYLSIKVEGQRSYSFKTYLHQCNSMSYGYYMKSSRDVEFLKYTVRADGELVDSGYISFKVKKEGLVK